jgi:hypothetical protein
MSIQSWLRKFFGGEGSALPRIASLGGTKGAASDAPATAEVVAPQQQPSLGAEGSAKPRWKPTCAKCGRGLPFMKWNSRDPFGLGASDGVLPARFGVINERPQRGGYHDWDQWGGNVCVQCASVYCVWCFGASVGNVPCPGCGACALKPAQVETIRPLFRL